jgi:hypothetical protein
MEVFKGYLLDRMMPSEEILIDRTPDGEVARCGEPRFGDTGENLRTQAVKVPPWQRTLR